MILCANSSRSVLRRLFAWRPGGYARASAETLVWLLLRAGLQAVSVVVLARLLGATEYGRFVAALAVVTFFVPFAGMGLGNVVVRDGSADPQRLPMLIGAGLWFWFRTALALSVLATAVVWLALPSDHVALWAVCLLGFGEVFGFSGVDMFSRYRQAEQDMRAYGAIMSGLIGVRLLALLLYAGLARHAAQDWMGIYGVVNIGYLALVAGLQLHAWRGNVRRQPGWWREGIPFAAAALSAKVQSDFNKPVIAWFSYADVGVFNIGQRVMDVVSLPLTAMQETLWPRVFSGMGGIKRLQRALLVMLVFSIIQGLLMELAAPILPRMLGAGFDQAVPILRLLAWLPVLQVLRSVGHARMVASGRSRQLIRVYVTNAVVGPLFSLFLIPHWGLRGAVAAVYISEAILIALLHLLRKTSDEYFYVKSNDGN